MNIRHQIACALAFVLSCTSAHAGPAEDAAAALVRWKAAYDANDNVAVGKLYAPDAILHGTLSRDMTVGREAITKYFTIMVGSGNTVDFVEQKITVISDSAAIVVGYNNFNVVRDGKRGPAEARFTMVLVKQGSGWLVAHHHSSPRPAPRPAASKQ